MFAAVQVVVGFAPVLAQFILCQMVITFASTWDAFTIDAVTAVPPSVCCTIFGFGTTGRFGVGFASISNNMVVVDTSCQLARTAAAYHGLAILWHLSVAVMPTFPAICRARLDINTFPITIAFICFALGTALATCTYQLARTFGTGRPAACVGILYTFTRLGVDVESVNTLQYFALAISTCTTLPSRDGICTYAIMQTAVFDGIDFTGILVDVHAFGTFAHLACCIHTMTRFPAVDAQSARDAMGAAICQIVGFTAIFVQMQTFLTCADLACPVLISAILPTCNFARTIGVMIAAMIHFIRLTGILEWMATG
jgi:hypothetical protein